MSETIDLLRADYYVYSAYIEGTDSKWSALREPIKLFNDVAARFFRREWCCLFGAGMQRAAAAFFAYKALCEKYGVEKIDDAKGSSPFRIECTRVHRLFSLGVEDFVSELDEKYDTFEMLKLASRQKDWLPSNWDVGPTTLSDGKRLLSNHQLICSLLGVARGLFQKHGESVMRDMPWMATFMVYNSACWLTVHIYQSLPSFKGKTVVALPLSDNISKEGKELIGDMVNLFEGQAMTTRTNPGRWPTKVWEDPDPDVEMTDEERKEFFGDGSPDTRTDEERRKDLESWELCKGS